MKKHIKEIAIMIIQLFMFYIFPLFAGPTDAMGMVFLIIAATVLLSLVLGVISDNKIKFGYPALVAVLFIPSVFIYYNESALIHSLWYLTVSAVGLSVGTVIRLVFRKKNNKQ